jgi:hypothetical protein
MIRTGKVPEDNHETPLLVEHVPRLRNALFPLCAVKNRQHSTRVQDYYQGKKKTTPHQALI